MAWQLRARWISPWPTTRDRSNSRWSRHVVYHAYRRRQKSVLSITDNRPRRCHDRHLAADRVDERPGRLVNRSRHPSDVYQQHTQLRRTTIANRQHGRRQVQTRLHRPRAASKQFVHAVGTTHKNPTAGRRRSSLYLTVGPRLPPRLCSARSVS